MAGERFLFVNSDGFYECDDAAITTSAGVADSDKLVKTNSQGKLDSSLLDFSIINRFYVVDVKTAVALPASTYNNGTAGVGATLTANANGTLPAIDGETLVVGSRILVDAVSGVAGPEQGIYEVTDLGSGSTPWILTRTEDYDQPEEMEQGTVVAVGGGSTFAGNLFIQLNEINTVGTDPLNFQSIGTTNVVGADGIAQVGNILAADLLASGGLKFVGTTPNGQIAVEPNDIAGTGLVDDGADNLAIDFFNPGVDNPASVDKAVDVSDLAANGTNQGANLIGADPSSVSQSSATTVQGILNDLSTAIEDTDGVQYTAGAGGVSQGDLVFISANDTVSTYGTLTNAERTPGLAKTAAGVGVAVTVLKNDVLLTGVLSGLGFTAGEQVYWNGSTYVNYAAATALGAGTHLYRVGIAKNTTDLHVEVDFLKKQ